jgi:RsiW-degrading membrane proteinase PrsW (M82 family)
MSTLFVYLFALIGGFIPALLWLLFWTSEDRKNPEPKRLIALAFSVGVLAVPLALAFEKMFAAYFVEPYSLSEFMDLFPIAGAAAIFVFAFIEEAAKFVAAYAAALWRKELDEPIDYIVYLIAAALGFAAYETALFVFTPFSSGLLSDGILMGNLRAFGAMLLHVVASSAVGLSLAFSFFRARRIRIAYGFIGLVISVILHGAFNLAIIKLPSEQAVFAFVSVWIAIVALLLLFERAKKIHPTFTH